MKATIIGVGNLGGAIAIGLAKGTFINAEDITCVDVNPAALEKMKATGLPFNLTSDLRKAVQGADILILAVKAHTIREINEHCRDVLDFSRQIFFSVVAGVNFEDMDSMMFGDPRKSKDVHFRVMPNIAISIGESMTFIASRNANAAQIKLAEAIFGEMGRTMVIPERLMPAGMAVASCGIAYAMRYVRAAMNGAIEAGFTAAEAHTIVLQTMKGATDLLLENGEHPEVEIDRVVTPGGFTIRGLNAMEEMGFSNAIVAGIRESYKNSK
jgi:pyrroline-5-carboxylate reductase